MRARMAVAHGARGSAPPRPVGGGAGKGLAAGRGGEGKGKAGERLLFTDPVGAAAAQELLETSARGAGRESIGLEREGVQFYSDSPPAPSAENDGKVQLNSLMVRWQHISIHSLRLFILPHPAGVQN